MLIYKQKSLHWIERDYSVSFVRTDLQWTNEYIHLNKIHKTKKNKNKDVFVRWFAVYSTVDCLSSES